MPPAGGVRQTPQDSHSGNRSQRSRWKIPTGANLEEYRQKMNILPSVVGNFLHYSNRRLKYNPIPDDVDEVREKLFVVEKPLLLTSQQIADHWPHMTNVWMRSVRHKTAENGVVEEVWECRQRRRVTPRPPAKESMRKKNRMSKRQMLENSEPCHMRLRLTYYTNRADTENDHQVGFGACKCIPEWLYMQRTYKTGHEQHNHEIDLLDTFKRSDAILYFVKEKAEEGNSFAAVANWLHDRYDDVTKQAHFMTKQEVSNVAQAWRRANKDLELKTVVEDPTPEEGRKTTCLDFVNTAKPEGLIRALAAVCERLPEAIDIAMPVLKALQERGADAVTEKIVEGADIMPPSPGFPKKGRAPLPS